jgi:hypothetical protein
MNARRLSCDALALCQSRRPPCKDCKPSEGTRSARLLLDNMPPMERPPFYIFPRDMEQAFGPGHRHLDIPTETMHPHDKVVMKVGAACVAAVAVMAFAGVLA